MIEKTLYWIDSFAGYPADIVEPSKSVYETLYGAYADRFGYRFRFVDSTDLAIATGTQPGLWHAELGNLLEPGGAAYVGLIHHDPVIERRQETIYRLLAAQADMPLLNYIPGRPMICKDKFVGIETARALGLKVPTTALIDCRNASPESLRQLAAGVGPYPLFIRPNDLTGGMGACSLADQADLEHFVAQPPYSDRSYLLQPELKIAFDYRVYLKHDRIVACRARRPLHGTLTTTIDGGGSVPTPQAIQTPSQVLARHLQSRYLCVDWLLCGDDHWFCEFETGGGFKDLDQPERDLVADAFFARLLPE